MYVGGGPFLDRLLVSTGAYAGGSSRPHRRAWIFESEKHPFLCYVRGRWNWTFVLREVVLIDAIAVLQPSHILRQSMGDDISRNLRTSQDHKAGRLGYLVRLKTTSLCKPWHWTRD